MEQIRYEVFVDSVYGSDLLTFETFEAAKAEADDWAKNVDKRNRVVVVKVTEEVTYEVEGRKQ